MSQDNAVNSYRDLKVWQRGIDLVEQVYEVSAVFLAPEKFGLTAQVRRAAVSIPSNVTEGWGRSSTKEYVRFLEIACSSLLEVETQIIVACRLGFISAATQDEGLEATAVES